jgi:predicted nucleic acid-binding protein
MDLLIAAHAVATGAVLVANDKAFAHVEDLRTTVNWATDLA